MKKPILVYQKNADKTTNKMIIPKAIIEQWGNQFYMEIYQDKIIQVEGYKEGKIATKIGKLGGFTFGPLFIPNGYQKPYNELTNFETHRHDAVNKLIKKLEELKII